MLRHLQRQEDPAVLIRHSMARKAFRLEIECSSQYQTSLCKAKVTPVGEQRSPGSQALETVADFRIKSTLV